MKILLIRNFPSFLDVKFNTYNIQEVGLAKALTRKGHRTDIVFWTDKEETDEVIRFDDDLSITVFYRKGIAVLKNAWYSYLDELIAKYDVIQPSEYNQMQSWYLAKKYPRKTVIYHGPYYSQFNKNYNRMCKVFDGIFLKSYIKQNNQFIVKSKLAKEFLLGKGIKSENIAVAGVGIDTQVLSSGDACPLDIYNKMCRYKEELKVLYIGRFEERRNLPFIIDVFKKVSEQQSNTHLYLIGTGTKQYVDSVFEYAKTQEVYDHISWQEKAEQKYLSNIYRKADFFLLPTEYEIFGMVMLEAMYYQMVVLSTKNGGSSTLIENEHSGFVFDNKDASDWANCILSIWNDKQRMMKIKGNASAMVRKGFTWDALTDIFIDQYGFCLQGR